MLNQRITRLIISLVRKLNTTSVIYSNHYEVLGITPKATQNDIKSAYYNLSKVYHPDKSSDEESAKKFRAITEAYEVLGNLRLKNMYDRGLHAGTSGTSSGGYQPDPEPTDPVVKFYKSRSVRHVSSSKSGKIYDFDAWSQHHYGNAFRKAQADKEFLRIKKEKQMRTAHAIRQESAIIFLFALTGLFLALVFRGTSKYDVDAARRPHTVPVANETNEIQTSKETP